VHRPASLSALRSVSSVQESLPLVLNSAPGVGPSGPSVFGPVPERDDLCCLSSIPAARQPDLVEVSHRVVGTMSSFSRCHPSSIRGFLVVRSVFPCLIAEVGLVPEPSDQRFEFLGSHSTLVVGSQSRS
jgi:hypothetical protein